VLCSALVVSQCSAAYLACYSALVLLSALVLSQCSRLCSCVPVGHYKWFLVQCYELSLRADGKEREEAPIQHTIPFLGGKRQSQIRDVLAVRKRTCYGLG
jgi:hypothetical protein